VLTRIVQKLNDDDNDVHDLHAARGLLPATLLGALLWAAAIVAVMSFW
jgi:hypothetical protein